MNWHTMHALPVLKGDGAPDEQWKVGQVRLAIEGAGYGWRVEVGMPDLPREPFTGALVAELAVYPLPDADWHEWEQARAWSRALYDASRKGGPEALFSFCREMLMHRRRECGFPVVAQTEAARRLAAEWYRWQPPRDARRIRGPIGGLT